jgi:hypothetical protein
MKRKGEKKTKIRKKWSKHCGDFSFAHATQQLGSQHVFVNAYYKEEFIGILSSNTSHHRKTKFEAFIYETYFNGEKSCLGKCVGTVHCYGLIHNLPKMILKVELNNESCLILKRKVIMEKNKKEEDVFDIKHFSFPPRLFNPNR